jgi:glycerol-3-phosphate dehydrogenase
VDRVLATVNREVGEFMGGTKGSHIVVDKFDGAPKDACYVEARQDGRPFFIIPWNGQYLIGTTDIRCDGDPGNMDVSEEEIAYLLRETNNVIPSAGLSASDINFAYAGVRPLPKRDKGPESAITRKHVILKHRKLARGLISIIGGKITTYRNLAEQAVDTAARRIKADASKCETRTALLPGAQDLAAARERLESDARFSDAAVERLLSVYGGSVLTVLDIADEPALGGFIDADRTILSAEVAHAIRNEMATNLIDVVHRRMMTGLMRDRGESCAQRIAELAGSEAGWESRNLAEELKALDRYNKRFRPVAG